MKDWAGARAASCSDRPTTPMSSRGPAPARASPSRRISASVRSTPASTSARCSGASADRGCTCARPVGVPVDRLAVLVRLRIGQQAGRIVAQPAAHHAAQLRGGVVQRLAAHAQGAHAATRGDDQRGLAGHSAVKIAGRLWRRDDLNSAGRRPARTAASGPLIAGSAPLHGALASGPPACGRHRAHEPAEAGGPEKDEDAPRSGALPARS